MKNVIGYTAAASAIAALSGIAFSEDNWYVRGGVSYMKLADEGILTADGVPVVGGEVHTPDDVAATVEVGKFVSNRLAITASVNGVYTTDNVAAGTLAGLGNFGTDEFAIADIGAKLQFNRDGRIQPYIGAGVSYFFVTDSQDEVLEDLFVEDKWGAHLRGGFDLAVNEKWSVYAEAKQYWIETEGSGTLGGSAIAGTFDIDPVMVNAGISYKF